VRVERLHLLAAGAFLAAALMLYAVTHRAPARIGPNTMFTYDQRTFHATRAVTAAGVTLHDLVARTDGNDVEVNWYDSSLAPLAARSGVDASLIVDGQELASTLIGNDEGAGEQAPATLRWAGPLPAGVHRFRLTLTRVDSGVEVPYVAPGHLGVDSLVVSQEPGGG
jgi:hypothetical protein